jgi:hypothetical protein
MVWDGFSLACVESYDLSNPFVDCTLRLIQHNWVVLAYNFNIVILMLINGELSIGAFLLTILFQFYPCYYLALSFYSYTCWVPTISVLNLSIFRYYSNQLLRRRRWTGILWWGVLGYVLPRLPFLWSYGVFCCSVSLRVNIVFRDIWLSVNTIGLYVCNHWSWIMHMMCTWCWHKNQVWQKWYQSRVNHRNTSLDRRVLFLVLF